MIQFYYDKSCYIDHLNGIEPSTGTRNCSKADERTFGMESHDHFGMASFYIKTHRTPSLKSAHEAIFSTTIVSMVKTSFNVWFFADFISL